MRYKTSIFSYIGGKYYLLKHLLPFPEHQIYLEVFGGSAVVLLNKEPARSETYNDTNKKFVNFWNVLKDYHLFLRLFCTEVLDSRDLFKDFLDGNADGSAIPSVFKAYENAVLARNLAERKEEDEITTIVKEWEQKDSRERVLDAFTYYYTIHHSFSFKGSAYNGMSLNWKDPRNKIRESFVQKTREDPLFHSLFKIFKAIVDDDPGMDIASAFKYFELDGRTDETRISWTWNRIKNVRFDCQDFRKIIPRFDRKGVLMYLDPPYFQSPDFVANSFTKEDHRDLLELLRGLKDAKFVLSIDDATFYKQEGWYYQEIVRNNCAGSKGKKNETFTEYIIRNFDNKAVKKGNARTILDYAGIAASTSSRVP